MAPAMAQQCADEDGPSQTLDPRNAQVLQKVFEAMQADQYQTALTELNNLLASRGESMKAFDRSTTYELRGSVKVNLEDYRGALRDFESALSAGGLPVARQNQLRYFIAQLNFQLESYQNAISGLNQWIQFARQCGQKVDPNAYYLLAAAYTQITPPNWRAAQGPAEQALAALTEPKKSYYDLLNLIYSENGEQAKRGSLLERMVNNWPGERGYWTQLSGLYNQMGRDSDAFAVLEVAYRAGLLKTESEILTLVQYFSFYDNPFRGAKLLEREMNAGTVNSNVRNLTLLSQLWSQAREHKRAIPVLQRASQMSSTGELSYRLGQVLTADEQYASAERALRTALNKGGMTARQTGDAWLLLGTAIFSQAGPEDVDIWRRARDAFVRAQNYSNTAQQARQWVQYIDAVIQTRRDGLYLECLQRGDQRKADIDRLTTQAQVCRLQGGDGCDEILDRVRALREEADQDNCAAIRSGSSSGPARPVERPDTPSTDITDDSGDEGADEDVTVTGEDAEGGDAAEDGDAAAGDDADETEE